MKTVLHEMDALFDAYNLKPALKTINERFIKILPLISIPTQYTA
jgi:hypothetical protein